MSTSVTSGWSITCLTSFSWACLALASNVASGCDIVIASRWRQVDLQSVEDLRHGERQAVFGRIASGEMQSDRFVRTLLHPDRTGIKRTSPFNSVVATDSTVVTGM